MYHLLVFLASDIVVLSDQPFQLPTIPLAFGGQIYIGFSYLIIMKYLLELEQTLPQLAPPLRDFFLQRKKKKKLHMTCDRPMSQEHVFVIKFLVLRSGIL